MTSSRSTVDELLERELRRESFWVETDESVAPTRLNAVWRRKVVHWYFTLVAALQRQHSSTVQSPGGDPSVNPFSRYSVHVTASLLDNYLMSLPSERAIRFNHDRPAYQLLATTCLLLGMRLAQHDQIKEARQREASTKQQERGLNESPGGLKRAKTHRTNMNEASASTSSLADSNSRVAIPNAATILRISAAPKSISEQHILSMVREMTSSRSFPRSKVVTALDFIHVLSGTDTHVSDSGDGSTISLGPDDAEEACRLADVLLRDASVLGRRPSLVACAVITIALSRSNRVNLNMASLRDKVYHSVYGNADDTDLQFSIRKIESKLFRSIQVGLPSPGDRQVVRTTHLIPLEDE
eukprot:CAMPEP_0183742472 /NCGR_PEP_ID=MMETSP0737-20130205/64715_1 /TAXON_ID=385413 /ORGANISM="Thalassiosira miniscula, Strain CCMP1093" /LENGTH=354 /DNA_ID=CAMNT_0025978059 /DNA_START=126 /DNA_END=1190 /DNA_ORIENTATION=-